MNTTVALSGDGFEHHDPVDVEGFAVATTLRPRSAKTLAAGLDRISAHGLAAVVRGAGRHSAVGVPVARADVLLSTELLCGIESFEPAEGICQVRAGTSLGALRAELAGSNWELPLAAEDAATVGGVLASGWLGARAHGYGPPRDCVLGLDVVLSGGERTRCGGRVVKNVTGYDLAKLYVGSFGTLGVIEKAWLRLRPVPPQTEVRSFIGDRSEVFARMLPLSRHVSVRACGVVASREVTRGIVEFAGDDATVAAGLALLPRGSNVAALDALDARASRVRIRQPALPSEHRAVTEALVACGGDVIAFPGLRFVYADFADASGFAAAESASALGSGRWRCEEAPLAEKRGRNVLGVSDSEVKLFRALKARFDPAATLAPGRLGEVLS